ncbi:hypothetical protein IG631_07888 [Alternaria alternata]|nr:hypothetical protein IG631_07888 [Alternaria alternata]
MDKGMWRGNYGWSLRCASAAAAMTDMAVREAATSSLGKGHKGVLRKGRCETEGGGSGSHEAGADAQGTLPRDNKGGGHRPRPPALRSAKWRISYSIDSRARLARIVR